MINRIIKNFHSAQQTSPAWTEWQNWFDCDPACREDTMPRRMRWRDCSGSPFAINCGPEGEGEGGLFVTEICPNIPRCPSWLAWGEWDECSQPCNTGEKRRERECSSGIRSECLDGQYFEIDSCIMKECEREMLFWNNLASANNNWTPVDITDGFFTLDNEESITQKCASYCYSLNNCKALMVTSLTSSNGPQIQCFVTLDSDLEPLSCWGTTCSDPTNTARTNVLGVFRDYFEENPANLPSRDFDSSYTTNFEDTDGSCTATNTVFGSVGYRSTLNMEFTTSLEDNLVAEPGFNDETQCATMCFERAGCSAFFENSNNCHHVVGSISDAESNDNIRTSGLLTQMCPQNVFTDTFTKRSRTYCKFRQANGISTTDRDRIIQQNRINFPLNQWNFESPSGSPLEAISQYVYFDFADNENWPGLQWRIVEFVIETHFRRRTVGVGGRKRRSSDTNDILRDLNQIEAQAFEYLFTNLSMPEELSVELTTPIETLSVKQISTNGNVAAYCASGSCQCSGDYIDNGDGCVPKTREQASQIQSSNCNPFSFTCTQSQLQVFFKHIIRVFCISDFLFNNILKRFLVKSYKTNMFKKAVKIQIHGTQYALINSGVNCLD